MRFERRRRTEAERLTEDAAAWDARIDELLDEIERLRAERDKARSDAVRARRQSDIDLRDAELADVERRRAEAVRRTTLSQAQLRRMKAELLGDGPISPERWYTLPGGRRRDFLKLVFPHGLLVHPAPPEAKRMDVSERLEVRTEDQAEQAAARKESASRRPKQSPRPRVVSTSS